MHVCALCFSSVYLHTHQKEPAPTGTFPSSEMSITCIRSPISSSEPVTNTLVHIGTTPAVTTTTSTATATTTTATTSQSLVIDSPNLRDGIAESFARNHRLRLFLRVVATSSSGTIDGAIAWECHQLEVIGKKEGDFEGYLLGTLYDYF